jgi:FRG domain
MVEIHRVESVANFVHLACDIRTRWTHAKGEYFDPWFRGQADARWRLSPGVFRYDVAGEENDLRIEFRRRGLQLLSERAPEDEGGWYFLMQHYGAPTRLLDWTDSALVALFFALNSNAAGRPAVAANAVVWMLDPWRLNEIVLDDARVCLPEWDTAAPFLPPLPSGELMPAYPIAVDPPHFARRLSVQRSHFTIFGKRANGLWEVARRTSNLLVKIVVPRRAIARRGDD